MGLLAQGVELDLAPRQVLLEAGRAGFGLLAAGLEALDPLAQGRQPLLGGGQLAFLATQRCGQGRRPARRHPPAAGSARRGGRQPPRSRFPAGPPAAGPCRPTAVAWSSRARVSQQPAAQLLVAAGPGPGRPVAARPPPCRAPARSTAAPPAPGWPPRCAGPAPRSRRPRRSSVRSAPGPRRRSAGRAGRPGRPGCSA